MDGLTRILSITYIPSPVPNGNSKYMFMHHVTLTGASISAYPHSNVATLRRLQGQWMQISFGDGLKPCRMIGRRGLLSGASQSALTGF